MMPPQLGGKSSRPWPQEPGCGGACGKRDRSRFKRAFDGDRIRWALCKCCSDYRVENWRGTQAGPERLSKMLLHHPEGSRGEHCTPGRC